MGVAGTHKTQAEKDAYKAMKAAMTPEERAEYNHEWVAKRNLPGNLQLSSEEAINDNRVYLANTLEIMNLSDLDMNDAEAVKKRISEYFAIITKNGMKPSVSGLCLALKIDRHQLKSAVTGKPYDNGGSVYRVPPATLSYLKATYAGLQSMWQDWMNGGKVNPASGIFIGKNHFGFVDQQETIVTPNVQQDKGYKPDSIELKYIDSGDDAEDQE